MNIPEHVNLGNKGSLAALLNSIQQLARDISDPGSQRLVYQLLGRCVTVWAQPPTASNGSAQPASQDLPGFDRFVYESLIPTAFGVLSSSEFNVKDGQMLVVSDLTSDLGLNKLTLVS